MTKQQQLMANYVAARDELAELRRQYAEMMHACHDVRDVTSDELYIQRVERRAAEFAHDMRAAEIAMRVAVQALLA